MKLWKPQLHLNMAFVEPCTDTGVLVGAAADDFSFCVTAEITVREDFLQKDSAVGGRTADLRVNGSRKTEKNTAGFQNQLIKVKNFRFPAPEVDFFEINFGCIFFQIQRKITEQPAAEAAVEVVLQHVMQHVKNIFRRRQHRIRLAVEFRESRFQVIGRENLVYQLIRPGKLIDADDAVMKFQRK